MSRNAIPIRIARASNDGLESLTAVTNLRNAMAVDNIREILERFEEEYRETIQRISDMLNQLKTSKKTDPIVCWKIGDMIHNLLHNKAKKYRISLTNYERTFARDLHISPSRISYFLHFRELHPKLSDVDPSIPWSWYLELNLIKDLKKLREIEQDIKNGKITTIKQLKRIIRA